MILHCNFEELQALRAGARTVLGTGLDGHSAVVAPAEGRARVEALVPQLDGDLAFHTLAELEGVLDAVHHIVDTLRVEMDACILAAHPAEEGAVAAYFEYAHVLGVYGRLKTMAAEMRAMIELVTGERADGPAAREFVFPD